MRRLGRALAVLAVLPMIGSMARGEPPPGAAASPPSPAAASPAAASPPSAEEDARAHFVAGIELLRKGAWAEALSEFSASQRRYPTPQATTNAAICLRKLGRYDEALDQVESLLHGFPELPEDKRQAAERERAQISELVGTIAVEGLEVGARVEVDARERGVHPMPDPLRVTAGSHVVRARKEGFVPFETRVEVVARETTRVWIRLTPTPAPVALPPSPPSISAAPPGPRYAAPPGPRRFRLELAGAMGVSPSFGGDIAGGCAGACSAGPGLGGYGVLRFGRALQESPFDLGVAAGFLAANQRIAGRTASLRSVGLPAQPFTADDMLKLRGGLVGAWVGARFGERPFVLPRFGLGTLMGRIGDQRTGALASGGSPIEPVGLAALAAFVYVAPEVRVGLRVADRVTLTAGLEALVLFGVADPAWDANAAVNVPKAGTSFFPAESLAGSVMLVVAPGLGAGYEF
jgi:hypothetical protein